MQAIHLHDGKFLTIRWDEDTRIISIKWKESSAAMTDGLLAHRSRLLWDRRRCGSVQPLAEDESRERGRRTGGAR